MQNRIRKREIQEKNESCALLRNELDTNDGSLPKSFTFNEGNATNIQTNIFPITFKNKDLKIFQYSVDTNPAISNSKQLSHLIYSSFYPESDKNIDIQKNLPILFDGLNIIFSTRNDLEGENSISDSKDPSKDIKISVKFIKEVTPDDVKSLIHLYNIIFHKAFKSIGLTQFGKKWLNDQDYKQIANFKIIGGFKPSLIALSGGISFIVNITYRIERQGSLYDYLKSAISNQNERADLISSLKEMQIFTTHLKEQKLINISGIDWSSDPSQLTFELIDKNTFQPTKISITNYFQQYHNFTIQRDDPLIETIFNINGEQQIDFFPASCLKITGITEAEKRNEQLMNEIREETSVPIDVAKQKLDALISRMKKNPDTSALFAKWGIEFNDSLTIDGRILDPPKIMFRTRQSDHAETDIQIDNKMSFHNELRNVGVAVPPRLNAVPLILSPSSCIQDIRNKFIPTIIQISKEIGISFLLPDLVELENSNTNSYRKEIIDYILKKGTPSFIIVVFPDVNKERYDAVKQLLTIDLGIPSQFVKSSTLFGNTDNANDDKNSNLISSKVFSNICLKLLFQITAKTGGICYYISPSTLLLNNTMIVGIFIDKPHFNSSGPIICSMAASYDQTLARYYSDTFIFPRISKDKVDRNDKLDRSSGVSSSNSFVFSKGRDDMDSIPPDYISDFIRRAYERYIKQRSSHPQRIIVYRGGANYGQMKRIKQEEVKAITDIIDPSISLTYVIVQTRNNIKMMVKEKVTNKNENENKTSNNKSDSSANNFIWTCPKAGTIVTDKIGAFSMPEFYIVSNEPEDSVQEDMDSFSLFKLHHESLTSGERSAIFDHGNGNKIGMVTPTKYTVIYHFPVVWSDEKLAKLTHYLTCIYPNWQGATKIPCPLMVASKLAEFTRTTLGSQRSNESLSDCLHFL